MPTTRHKAALRLAEGRPPSPQNEAELPRELRGPQRRKKKTTHTTRSTITPDSGEDSASQKSQDVPAQTLREGNAGGYVRDNTSEQHHFLPETQTQPPASLPSNVAQEHLSSDEATARRHIHEHLPNSPVRTPPQSPSAPTSSPATKSPRAVSIFRSALSGNGTTQRDVPHAQPAVDRTRAAVSVSTRTDGPLAATVSTTVSGAPIKHTTPLVSTAATQTSPFVPRALPQATPPPTRTLSMQTNASADRFKSMSLYVFERELAVTPESCSLTLHLDDGREIRVSKVSSAALDQIKEILRNQTFVFQRNWLTAEETALETTATTDVGPKEADATEKQPHSSAKRKRVIAEEETPNTRRRRLNPAKSPTPSSLNSLKPSRLRSRMRKNRSLAGRSQAPRSPIRSASSSANSPAVIDSTVRYGNNGNLRLLGASREVHQQRNSSVVDPAAVGATTGNESDDESEFDSILEWPVGLYWSNNAAATSSPAVEPGNASEPDLDARQTRDTAPAATERNSIAPAIETPQPSRWRLGNILNTARRLIPGIGQRQAPPAAPLTVRPTVRTQNTVDSHGGTSPHRGAQTEPRRYDQRPDPEPKESTSNFAQRLRNSQTTTQKAFRSKENIEELKKMKAEKEKLAAEWAKLEEERKSTELVRKDVEDAHRIAYARQQPGSKRPRRPSPRVIPNPKGVSYGLDPAYFYDSDEDEDEPEPSPLGARRARKARRIQGSERSRPGTQRGVSDEDNLFSKSVRTSAPGQALQYHGSCFSDSPPNTFQVYAAQSKAKEQARKSAISVMSQDAASSFNWSGHFEVPYSSSSSEEDEGEEISQVSPSEQQPTTSAADNVTSGTTSSVTRPSSNPNLSDATVAASSRITGVGPMKAPATPEPGPRAVRFANGVDPSETLQRNRQMLRDQMQQLQKQKSVPSPQDVVKSPQKVVQKLMGATSNSPALMSQSNAPGSALDRQQKDIAKGHARGDNSNESLLVEPDASSNTDGFTIRGAAKGTPPDTSPYLFVETLPPDIAKMHAYEDFQQILAPSVKELLEASWETKDAQESEVAFQSEFTEYFDSQQPQVGAQAISTRQETDSAGPFVDDSDDDEASFYPGDDQQHDDQMRQSAVGISSTAQPNTAGNQILEPAVAAFLDSQWTPEDEAHASAVFKEYWTSSTDSDASSQEAVTALDVTA
ncbi:MAG: hypothetical protein LQ344_007770 [Seirophora lacunosa]|nr:MAG: hypothetical protein LQ344_007770 [Seirophora lacunosa]